MSNKMYFSQDLEDRKGTRRKTKSSKKPPQDIRTVRGNFPAGQDDFLAKRAFLAR
jgi:hypothetical protein